MDQKVYNFISEIEDQTLSTTACICHACYKQASRNVGNENYHPRWKPKTHVNAYCGVTNCILEVHRHTNMATLADMEKILGTKISKGGDDSVPLCQKHYMTVYAALHAPHPCHSCNSKPRWGEEYFRHCPSPDIINSYLKNMSSESCTLVESSTICNRCYQFFNSIITHFHHTKSIIQEIHSTAGINLETVMATISSQIDTINSKANISREEYYDLIFCYTAQNIAKKLTKNEAMLLPTIYRSFFESAALKTSLYPYLNLTTSDIPSTLWFISRLHHYLGEDIVMECKHKRIGTMIYHKNCDLSSALSHALGQQKTANKHEPDSTTIVNTVEHNVPTKQDIEIVALYLNTKLHEQSRKLVQEFREPENYTKMSISNILKNTDPILIQFLKQLTCIVNERRKKHITTEEGMDIRTIRQFYALCVLLFNTNTICSAPMHVLLTEIILCHKGSLELVKIMNRIGAVASLDTCNRLSTLVVQKRLRDGIKIHLVPGMLSVISIDNIDIQLPHGIVSCMDDTRSWHGTSTQCTQPMPITGMLSAEERVSNSASQQTESSPVVVHRHKRRKRTLTEQSSPHTHVMESDLENGIGIDNLLYQQSDTTPNINDFLITGTESATLDKLKRDIHFAMLLKHFNKLGDDSTTPLPAIPSFIHCLQKQSTEAECSNVVYVDVLSEKADSKATLLHIGQIHKTFITELDQKWVLVVGDAKIYDVLQAIRIEYGDNVNWLIPIPGDWHTLYNYQKVLMKPYYDAGLVNLAKKAGFRSETLKSLKTSSNFRRTHLFLLECFESVYEYFLQSYGESIDEFQASLCNLLDKFKQIKNEVDLEEFRLMASSFVANKLPTLYSKFLKHLETLVKKHDTYKFWHGFLFEDCLPYLSLYISIRYRNWEMRVASLKHMVPLYTAFDHGTYQRLLPRHLFDLCRLPDCLKLQLKRGAFAVRLSPSDWCGVALDECHEMKINKDCKLAVVRPNREKMTHLSNYLPFRSACINNLKSQILPKQNRTTCYTPTTRDKIVEENTKAMVHALSSHGMVDSDQEHTLCTLIDHKQATPDQSNDLLHFRKIGQEAFEAHMKYRILKEASTTAPVRKKRLLTFSITQTQRNRIKSVEKERKITQRFLKRHLAWATPTPGQNPFQSISSVPLALVGKDGLPYKSAKHLTTKYLTNRYKDILLTSLQWTPTSVILEGMFMIQMTPFPTIQKMKEYAKMLCVRYIK